MPILTEQERIGTLLAGRYQLEAILGKGGTGVVFEATHNWTGRKVAVKLLKPEYSRDIQLTRRFLQEARAAAGLSHPHVVQVLDMGNENDGTVHLVLEKLEGESLGARLESAGRLSPEETLTILVPIMDALALAHRRGIIHRDLKPDNIFLHRDGAGRPSPKLLDFGMSKMVDAAWGTATSSGTLVGTPFYMSPEQAEGRKDQGPASDVWSMGVILYRCLTGALPFYADTPTMLLIEIVKAEPKPVTDRAPDVPAELAAVIDRCLVEDREERWKSMEALLDALRDAATAAGIPFPALPDTEGMEEPEEFDPGPRREPRAGTRTPMMIGAALLLCAALAGGVLWATRTPEAVAEAEAGAETGTGSASEPVAASDSESESESGAAPESVSGADAVPETGADAATAAAATEESGSDAPASRPAMVRPRTTAPRSMMSTSTTMETSEEASGMRLPGVAEEW